MPDRHVDHLLIGGGIASVACARALREQGAEGSILLVGRELDPPYHRPTVTKEFLRGTIAREEAFISPAGWWDENAIELMTRTSVMELRPEAREATLSNKLSVTYDQALLATGAGVRRLNAQGGHLEGIHYLRTLGNAESLRRDVEGLDEVVILGGSYVACEVAASLTELGKRCTIVMQENVVFERTFGPQAGRFFQGVLEDHGIEIRGAQECQLFDADPDEPERVGAVVLDHGERLEAQAVVAGVGAVPDLMLARRSGLELGEKGGVRCDSRLRTSAAGLFAAGDMCEYDSVLHGRPMRIEHEEVAAAQGRTVGENMLGRDRAHAEVPYFFSDLSDWVSLEYVGPAPEWEHEVIRGSIEDGRFSLWYLHGGRVAGVLAVGCPEDLAHGRRLISEGVDVSADAERLGDGNCDLARVGA